MGWFRKFLRQVGEPAALATLTGDAIPYGEMNDLFEA
jgi:hypothetical protein